MAEMTTTAFRMRLALALGLPLSACGSSPPPPPETPPATATRTTGKAHTGACVADEVPEYVCGRMPGDKGKPTAGAPAPRELCPASAVDLDDLEDNGVMDGWRKSSGDKAYEGMAYSQARSAAYSVNNGVFPDEPRCCYERCQPLAAIEKPRAALPAGMHAFEDCLPKPVRASHPAAGAPGCPAAMHVRLWYPYGDVDPFDAAPFERATANECCYMVATTHRCPPNTFEEGNECKEPSPGGRPLREDGVAVVAPTHARDGWTTPATVSGLSPAARAFAASAWAREAAFEHASVAAFARLAVELMAHAAPADLVDAALAAARDEVRHAQRCYGLAAAFGGDAVGPGPLPVETSTRIPSLEQLAVDCFRDGCVNETVAALCVAEAARRALIRCCATRSPPSPTTRRATPSCRTASSRGRCARAARRSARASPPSWRASHPRRSTPRTRITTSAPASSTRAPPPTSAAACSPTSSCRAPPRYLRARDFFGLIATAACACSRITASSFAFTLSSRTITAGKPL